MYKIEIDLKPILKESPMYHWSIISDDSVVGYGLSSSISNAGIDAENFLKNYEACNKFIMPIPINTKVWIICMDNIVRPFIVEGYDISTDGTWFYGVVEYDNKSYVNKRYAVQDYGLFIFNTKEEAELITKKG